MMLMKKILYALMMLVMLTPSLACAATTCAAMGQHSQVQKLDEPPCHGEAQQDSGSVNLMFFKDCTKADLGQVDHDSLVQLPEFQIDDVFYNALSVDVLTSLSLKEQNHIRGPPFVTASLSSYPPLYMATQRLRI